jgi:hypothetical protein
MTLVAWQSESQDGTYSIPYLAGLDWDGTRLPGWQAGGYALADSGVRSLRLCGLSHGAAIVGVVTRGAASALVVAWVAPQNRGVIPAGSLRIEDIAPVASNARVLAAFPIESAKVRIVLEESIAGQQIVRMLDVGLGNPSVLSDQSEVMLEPGESVRGVIRDPAGHLTFALGTFIADPSGLDRLRLSLLGLRFGGHGPSVAWRRQFTDSASYFHHLAIASDGRGGGYLAWIAVRPTSESTLAFRLTGFDREGEPRSNWTPGGIVELPTSSSGTLDIAAMASSSARGECAYIIKDGLEPRVGCVSVDGGSCNGWPEHPIFIGQLFNQFDIGGFSLQPTANGEAWLVVWSERASADATFALHRHVLPSGARGNRVEPEHRFDFCVANGRDSDPELAVDESGAIRLHWQRNTPSLTNGDVVFA